MTNLAKFIDIKPSVDMFRVAPTGLEKDEVISYTGEAVFSFDLQLENGLFTVLAKEPNISSLI